MVDPVNLAVVAASSIVAVAGIVLSVWPAPPRPACADDNGIEPLRCREWARRHPTS